MVGIGALVCVFVTVRMVSQGCPVRNVCIIAVCAKVSTAVKSHTVHLWILEVLVSLWTLESILLNSGVVFPILACLDTHLSSGVFIP